MNPPATRKHPARKMNPPATTIEDLPPEMICELFKHLPLKDILVSCSLVNKRWHSIVDDFKVHTLVVTDEWYAKIFSKWTYLNRRTQDHELCDGELFNRLADHPRAKHLKRLALLCGRDQADTSNLESFSQLQHLEFIINSLGAVNHSELEVLVCYYPNIELLSIDCPKLRVLVYQEDEGQRESLLNVKHPETIRELRTNLVGAKLDPFKSVQCLVTLEIEAISRATLQSLPVLKKLHFDEDIEKVFRKFGSDKVGTLDRMKRRLKEFLCHVKQLKRADLRFRFAGLKLTDETLDEIDFDMQVKAGRETVYNESVYLKNYHLIEPDALLFIRGVDYSRLMSNVTGDLPADFFEKFAAVDTVDVTVAVQDDRHFRWFLKSLRSCTSLWLAESQLGADFFQYYLPKLVPFLDHLNMNAYDPTGLLFDFKFLREFPRLSRLSIRGGLTLETVRSLTDLLEGLDTEVEFEFECKGRSVLVEKRTVEPVWNVTEDDEWPMEFSERKDLIDCLK